MAEDFGVSMTPVRDCLNRLVGERLVELKPGEGYRVSRLTEKYLRDMLGLNQLLLVNAVSSGRPDSMQPPRRNRRAAFADLVGTTFVDLVQWSENSALIESVKDLNDRLHAIYRLDCEIISDGAEEIDSIIGMAREGGARLAAAICDFHRKRRSEAPRFIALLNAG